MSVICDVLIIGGDGDSVEWVNMRLREVDTARSQQFAGIDMGGAGGSKYVVTDVWGGAFNHLVPYVIEEAIAKAPWQNPDEVTVYLHAYDYDLPPVTRTVTELREYLA